MDNIALLNLEGMSMAGHPGVAAKLFGALQRVGISVILISQVRFAVVCRSGCNARKRSVDAPLSLPALPDFWRPTHNFRRCEHLDELCSVAGTSLKRVKTRNLSMA